LIASRSEPFKDIKEESDWMMEILKDATQTIDKNP